MTDFTIVSRNYSYIISIVVKIYYGKLIELVWYS